MAFACSQNNALSQGFSSSSLVTFWVPSFFVAWTFPGNCQISNITMPEAPLRLYNNNKECYRQCETSGGQQNVPGGNHCPISNLPFSACLILFLFYFSSQHCSLPSSIFIIHVSVYCLSLWLDCKVLEGVGFVLFLPVILAPRMVSDTLAAAQ